MSDNICVDHACVRMIDQIDLYLPEEELVLKTIYYALGGQDINDVNLPPCDLALDSSQCHLAKLNAIIQAVKTWFKS